MRKRRTQALGDELRTTMARLSALSAKEADETKAAVNEAKAWLQTPQPALTALAARLQPITTDANRVALLWPDQMQDEDNTGSIYGEQTDHPPVRPYALALEAIGSGDGWDDWDSSLVTRDVDGAFPGFPRPKSGPTTSTSRRNTMGLRICSQVTPGTHQRFTSLSI